MLQLLSKQCVNSKWMANFIAKENQESCECGMCKVRVKHNNYEYIVTQSEYEKLAEIKVSQLEPPVKPEIAEIVGMINKKLKELNTKKSPFAQPYKEGQILALQQLRKEIAEQFSV